jgi:two-component system cell cycle sensor histidine kinase/response regulator CckA
MLQEPPQRYDEQDWSSIADRLTAVVYAYRLTADGGLQYTFLNSAIETLLGFTVEEWTREPGLRVGHVHPDDRARVAAAIDEWHRRGGSLRLEYRCLTRDGRQVRLEEIGTTVAGAGGQPEVFVGAIFAVADRGEDDAEKRRHDELLRLVVEGLPHPTFIINRQRRILACNRAGREWADVGEYCWEGIHKLTTISPDMRSAYQATGVPLPGTRCWFCQAEEALEEGQVRRTEVLVQGRYWDTWWVPLGHDVYMHYAADVTEYRQTQEELVRRAAALEASERRFRDVLDGLRLVAVMLDREGNITYANPFLLQLTGWELEELVGRNWFETFVPAKERQEVRAEAFNGAAKAERFPPQYENHILTRSGERRLIRWHTSFLRDPEGNIVGTASIGEDITWQRRLEQANDAVRAIAQAAAGAGGLAELCPAVHRALQELVPAESLYIALYDRERNTVSFPYFAEDRRPRPDPRSDGKGLAELVLQMGRPVLLDSPALARLREEGKIAARVLEPLYYLGVPLKEEDGSAYGIIALETYEPGERLGPEDQALLEFVAEQVGLVLARVRAQEERWQAEQRYRTLVENANEAILVGQDGALRFANPKAAELLGVSSPDELLGRPMREFLLQEEQQTLMPEGEAVLGKRLAAPVRIINSAGKVRWVEVSATMIPWQGRPAVMHFLSDVTERRSLEEQLRQSQKMEVIGRLAGGVAHDFNNLLTGISGYAAFALDALPANHPARQDIQGILGAADKAARLTRQLLAFSRRQILAPQLADMNRLVLELDKLLRRIIGEDVELSLRLADSLWPAYVDVNQVEQALFNLAANARDAMPSGGKLVVETANVALDEEYAREHHGVSPGDYVMLAVSDTGIGMTPEVQEHLFEPFFTTKEVDKGTGLGLASVYGIVKQHGGNIYVYSEPGKGTVVRLYFPRATESVQAGPERRRPANLPGGDETILVVEDEPAVRQVITRILTPLGYEVIEARNGSEALQKAREHATPIHLLLTDMVMPGMSGKELAQQLSRLQPGATVLYLSGYSDETVADDGFLEQGAAFMQKPFTALALAVKVRQVLDATKQRQTRPA